jgi:hypothetical protein
VEAPDLSAAILREVGIRRGFVTRRQRRLVCLARWAAGAAVVAVAAGVFLAHRLTPVEEALVERERPLAELMRSVSSETSVAVQAVSTRVRSIPSEIVSQSRELVAAGEAAEAARVYELDREPRFTGDWMDLACPMRDGETMCSAMVREGFTSPEGSPITIVWGSDRYRTAVGLGWAPALRRPGEAPLFENAGLDRGSK